MKLAILFFFPVIVMAIYYEPCNRCVNKQCEWLQCTYGCESEYYLSRHPTRFDCMTCAQNKNCASCQNRKLCTKCNDGYYVKGNRYKTSCKKCHWNCLTCVSYNQCLSCRPGLVLEGYGCYINQCTWNCEICTANLVCSLCKRGWYGLLCNNFCDDKIAHCASCQETNGKLTCNECAKSYSLLNATCHVTSQKTSTACTAAGSCRFIVLGAVGGSGGLLVIGIICFFVTLLRRRKSYNRNASNQYEMAEYGQHSIDLSIHTCRLSPSEADIPSADISYDGDGLFGPCVKVSNLLEYVRQKTDYDSEFQKLPKGLKIVCFEALKTHNREKTRFNGIYAYDATRVVLGSESYINANYIDGHSQSKAYIASDGPTSDTMNKFSTFWEMIWQEGVEAIVMLTNLEERGKMKCEQYWPNPCKTKTCLDYIVKCGAENVFAEFVVREITLGRNGFSERLNLTQYHYTAWSDGHVPDTVASLVEFRDKVEHIERRTRSPVVVHGSAGIGRTGTYIALDLLINEGRDFNYVDLFGCALDLRYQRVFMIQNEALEALPVPSKRLSSLTSHYADRKENREETDVLSDIRRVKQLSSMNGYINAVYVNGYQRKRAYIAAQTPTRSTIDVFLDMVYIERYSRIVNLDDENSALTSVVQYLPAFNETTMFGQYRVQCDGVITCDDYIIRDVVISKSPTDQLKIKHYQFSKWKEDDLLPSSSEAFMNLVLVVRSSVNSHQSSDPVLLHCLTGSKRCDVFCAVSTMMEKLAIDRQINGVHSFSQIRSRRNTALQEQEMLKFCYHCVLASIDSPSSMGYYYNGFNFSQ